MQAPTDNLYKFISISGLVCFIFFNFDMTKKTEALSSKVEVWRLENSVLTAQNKNLEKDIDRFSVTLANAKKNGVDSDYVKELDQTWESQHARLAEINITKAKLDLTADLIREGLEEVKRIYMLYRFLGSLSFGLFTLGLFLWYRKTQRYLDIKEAIIPDSRVRVAFKDRLPRRK